MGSPKELKIKHVTRTGMRPGQLDIDFGYDKQNRLISVVEKWETGGIIAHTYDYSVKGQIGCSWAEVSNGVALKHESSTPDLIYMLNDQGFIRNYYQLNKIPNNEEYIKQSGDPTMTYNEKLYFGNKGQFFEYDDKGYLIKAPMVYAKEANYTIENGNITRVLAKDESGKTTIDYSYGYSDEKWTMTNQLINGVIDAANGLITTSAVVKGYDSYLADKFGTINRNACVKRSALIRRELDRCGVFDVNKFFGVTLTHDVPSKTSVATYKYINHSVPTGAAVEEYNVTFKFSYVAL